MKTIYNEPHTTLYTRYRVDWVIYTYIHWQLRRVIKNMYTVGLGLKLKLALKKTFIGPIHQGFDFLGYRFNAHGLINLSQKTIVNHLNKRLQLYKQGASDQRVQPYKTAWRRWVYAEGVPLP
jgi:hypothetical protein